MRVAVLVLVTIRLAVAELQAEQVEVAASGKFGILRPPLLGAGGLNPVQTCIGAFCQQNNHNHGGQGGGGFGGGGNTFHPRPPFIGGGGSGGGLQPSQTCLGGQCQQNNDNLGLGPGHGGAEGRGDAEERVCARKGRDQGLFPLNHITFSFIR